MRGILGVMSAQFRPRRRRLTGCGQKMAGSQPGCPVSKDSSTVPSFDGPESGLITKTGWSGHASSSFALPLLQNQPDAMQVGRQH